MKITYQNLVDYSNLAFYWLRKKKENADTKLGYAITRTGKKVEKAIKPYKELLDEQGIEIEDINIKHASVDKSTGVLIFDKGTDEQGKDSRQYKYTPEKLIQRNKEVRQIAKSYEEKIEAFLEKEATLESPYFATEVPEDLTIQEKETFEGIVIAPKTTLSSAPTNGKTEEVLTETEG